MFLSKLLRLRPLSFHLHPSSHSLIFHHLCPFTIYFLSIYKESIISSTLKMTPCAFGMLHDFLAKFLKSLYIPDISPSSWCLKPIPVRFSASFHWNYCTSDIHFGKSSDQFSFFTLVDYSAAFDIADRSFLYEILIHTLCIFFLFHWIFLFSFFCWIPLSSEHWSIPGTIPLISFILTLGLIMTLKFISLAWIFSPEFSVSYPTASMTSALGYLIYISNLLNCPSLHCYSLSTPFSSKWMIISSF